MKINNVLNRYYISKDFTPIYGFGTSFYIKRGRKYDISIDYINGLFTLLFVDFTNLDNSIGHTISVADYYHFVNSIQNSHSLYSLFNLFEISSDGFSNNQIWWKKYKLHYHKIQCKK